MNKLKELICKFKTQCSIMKDKMIDFYNMYNLVIYVALGIIVIYKIIDMM